MTGSIVYEVSLGKDRELFVETASGALDYEGAFLTKSPTAGFGIFWAGRRRIESPFAPSSGTAAIYFSPERMPHASASSAALTERGHPAIPIYGAFSCVTGRSRKPWRRATTSSWLVWPSSRASSSPFPASWEPSSASAWRRPLSSHVSTRARASPRLTVSSAVTLETSFPWRGRSAWRLPISRKPISSPSAAGRGPR